MTRNLAEASRQANSVAEFLVWLEMQKPASAEIPSVVQSEAGLQKPAAFWDYIRGDAGELFPVITQQQVDGVNADLSYGAGKLPTAWMAYCLATDYHETAKTMQGVKEGLNLSDAWRQKNLRYFPWYGRGKVQLTWEPNYAKATQELRKLGFDVDLIKAPDTALCLDVATAVLIEGMLAGWFTGKKLRDYIPAKPERSHYRNARRIVNLLDKADLIAGYAVEFEKALRLGEWK